MTNNLQIKHLIEDMPATDADAFVNETIGCGFADKEFDPQNDIFVAIQVIDLRFNLKEQGL